MNILVTILFITCFFDGYQLFPIGTYGVTLSDLILIFIHLCFFKKIIWDGKRLAIGFNWGLVFYFILIAIAFTSSATSLLSGSPIKILQFFKTFIHFITLAFFVVVVSSYKQDTKMWENLIRTFLVLSIFINIFGIYQIIARAYDLPFAWLSYSNISFMARYKENIDVSQLSLSYEKFFRATSIFSEPSALAAFNLFILIFLFVPSLHGWKRFIKSKMINVLIFIASIAGLFLSFTLSGLVGVFVLMAAVIVFEKGRAIIGLVKIVCIASVIIIIADYMIYSYSEISVAGLFEKRISSIIMDKKLAGVGVSGESFGTRLDLAERSIVAWLEHPVIGSGIGQTYLVESVELSYSTTSFLAALVELGIFGATAFLLMFVGLFFSLKKIRRVIKAGNLLSGSVSRLVDIAFYLLIIMTLYNFVTGNTLVSNGLWMYIAIIFSVLNIALVDLGKKVYSIGLVSTPLKQLFQKNMLKYLKNS